MNDSAAGTLRAEWMPRQEDFDRFAVLSGDDNPIHVDPEFSGRTRFGRTVSHGMLLYSRVHALISNAFPGRRHRMQTLMFPNPAYAGEVLRITVAQGNGGVMDVVVERACDGAIVLQGACRLEAVR
ncbi:MaoC/PaaZ C-terminal domain-containing protein [Breoghania sp. JC706]|uniref:MaoC/PaaZ C-terminal domain-containing protein n=1 Tax=Breoghania sp. JC706 TaxID=3117732 RepID=UPI0030096B2A